MTNIWLLIFIVCSLPIFATAQKAMRTENVFKAKVLNSPLKIISQPRAPYPTSEGGSICMRGVVRLKVTFLETGQIGAIKIVSGMPFGATENAIEAAKKIKFVPAIKDGKPVTVSKTVEYRFKEF
jgi:TonB family protein